MQGVDAAEDDDRDDGKGSVSACGMIGPARTDEGVDEQETSDEEERVVEEEQIHEPVPPQQLGDARHTEDEGEDDHGHPHACGVVGGDDLLCDARAEDGHDVERDEVKFPPEICHAVDAREEGGAARRP